MLLGHQTDPSITNMYKILKNGYLKSGKETGVVRMWGWNKPSKYVYLTIVKLENKPYHFALDSELVLQNVAYLNQGWSGEPTKNSIKIIGNKLNKTKLNNILNKYSKAARKTGSPHSHEILVERQISLQKYLRKIQLFAHGIKKAEKTYRKLVDLMKKKYPKVEIVIFKPR